MQYRKELTSLRGKALEATTHRKKAIMRLGERRQVFLFENKQPHLRTN